MTIELKNLEADFTYIKDECSEEKSKAGSDLRIFGRRLLNLADEFVPQKINSTDWRRYQMTLRSRNNSSSYHKSSSNGSSKTGHKSKQNKNGYSPIPQTRESPKTDQNLRNSNNNNGNVEYEASVTLKIPALRV